MRPWRQELRADGRDGSLGRRGQEIVAGTVHPQGCAASTVRGSTASSDCCHARLLRQANERTVVGIQIEHIDGQRRRSDCRVTGVDFLFIGRAT